MTPAARLSAAIEVLDAILAGSRAEPALIGWGRASRFAGSGDRLAVRDLVYEALRRRRSAAWVGGAETGRGLVLGLLRLRGDDPATVFTGDRHAPAPVTADEAGRPLAEAPRGVRLDCPDWLIPRLEAVPDAEAALLAAQSRAPVFLRVNLSRASREEARQALAAEDIQARPHGGVRTALEVTEGERKIARSAAYAQGLVELQDAHSQAVVEALGPVSGLRVLDYCAGGGGKSLMLADLGAEVTAHDAFPQRMRDLAPRAARAGLSVGQRATEALGAEPSWPLIIADAPCSGSGTWRRDPEGKWALTPERLAELTATQDAILDACAALTAPGGRLAFVTCSLLAEEGPDRAAAFLGRHRGWKTHLLRNFRTGPAGDGFQLAIMTREAQHQGNL